MLRGRHQPQQLQLLARKRPPNQRELRRAGLGPSVAKIHTESFRTYGYVRVAAELRLGHGVIANHKLVHSIMRE